MELFALQAFLFLNLTVILGSIAWKIREPTLNLSYVILLGLGVNALAPVVILKIVRIIQVRSLNLIN